MGRYTDLIDPPLVETQSEQAPDDNPFCFERILVPDGLDTEAAWAAQRQACWQRFQRHVAIVQATVPAGREWRYRQYGKAAAAAYGPMTAVYMVQTLRNYVEPDETERKPADNAGLR